VPFLFAELHDQQQPLNYPYINNEIMASSNVLELSDADFDQAVSDDSQPTLVDFWAPWCGPCKMIAPLIEEIADEKQGSVRVAKVNVDDNPAIAQKHEIRAIPTLLVFRGGEVKQRITGLSSKADIISKVEAA